MATITFDVAAFRVAFPAFASETTFPDETLQGYFDSATCFISDCDYGVLRGDCRADALNLMTAHLAELATKINAGMGTGLVSSSTIDKISVTLTPPPFKSQFQWWLTLTGYGQRLYALLSRKAAGGLYVGGLPERSAFRKVRGIF
jgi:hypothetical protein